MDRAAPFLLMLCLLACQRHSLDPAGQMMTFPVSPAVVSLHSCWDLPKRDPRAHELSGIAWDPSRRVLYAIPDKTPRLVELIPDAAFHRWRFGVQIAVPIPGVWDGEGLAVTAEDFLIASEAGPMVYAVRRIGGRAAPLVLPEHFQRSRGNLGLESLTITEDQRYLFTANEQALAGDGPTTTRQVGTLVRILRLDRSSGAQMEFAYRTDPISFGGRGGGLGVTDLAALSRDALLVMERSYVPGAGNSVRIYRISTEGAFDTRNLTHLDTSTPTLSKTLLLDLATLPDSGFPIPDAPQPNKILANFEGLALGPLLDDERRVLFLISDDNSSATQRARLLVLVARL